MKNVWKRMMSLALSGVLLVGSLPLGALATEEASVPTETQVQETQAPEALVPETTAATEPAQPEQTPAPVNEAPQQTDPVTEPTTEPTTQPTTAPTEAPTDPTEAPADNTTEEGSENGAGQPGRTTTESEPTKTDTLNTQDNVYGAGQTGDGTDPQTVEYDILIGTTKITESIAENVLGDGKVKFDKSHTVTLNEATVDSITSTADLDYLVINLEKDKVNEIKGELKAKKGIKITGEGTLKVGSIDAGENLEIVNASVKVGEDKKREETNPQNLISIKNEISISRKAHLVTAKGHNAVVNNVNSEEEPPAVTIRGSGYYCVSAQDGMKPIASDGSKIVIQEIKEYVEIISEDHLDYSATTEKHTLGCNIDCKLDHAKISEGAHSGKTAFKMISDTYHQEIYDCCKVEKGAEVDHTWKYTSSGATVTAHCSAECGIADKTVTLTAKDTEYTGAAVKATYDDPDNFWGTKEIVYQNITGETPTDVTGAPVEIGKYSASVTFGDEESTEENKKATATVEFSITQKSFANAVTVTVGGEYTYNGQAHTPTDVTVKLGDTTLVVGTDYNLSYENNTNAGEATVKVTPVDTETYTGVATAKFTINPKPITDSDVKLGPTLTYNGQEQTQTVVKADEESDVTFEVTGNQKTEVGEYTLTVTGTGNYTGTVTLEYSIAGIEATLDLPDAVKSQTIAGGAKGGYFVEPQYKVGSTVLPGTFTYSLTGAVNTDFAGAQTALRNKESGEPVEVTFTFTPENAKNYTNVDNFTGKMTITPKEVKFAVNLADGTVDRDLLGSGDKIYGVAEPVDASKIKAFVDGNEVNEKPNYTITYFKTADSTTAVTERPLPVGTYRFEITFTGTVGGVACKDYAVYSSTGTFEIKPAPIELEAAPTGKHLTVLVENAVEKDQKLIDEITVVKPTTGAKVEYNVNGAGWEETVPEESAAGRYEVKYRVTAANHKTEEKSIITIIQPQLTAVYDQTLKDVELPEDGKWKWVLGDNVLKDDELKEHSVGNAGVNTTFKMQFGGANEAFPVNLNVEPKPIKPKVNVNDYIHYDNRLKTTNIEVFDGETELTYNTDYTIGAATANDATKITYTISEVEKGNYTFTKIEKEVKLYRPAHGELTSTNFPTSSLSGKNHDSLDEVKEALCGEIEADNFPESAMKYFSVYLTKKSGTNWVEYRAEGAFPTDGIDYVIPYEDIGAEEADTFKVSVMDTYGDNAGKEAKDITFTETADGLKIHLTQYAAVCVAVEVDPDTEFEITKSILLDDKTTAKGNLTFKVDSKEVTKTTHGKTVNVTASADSGYSIVSVGFKAENGASVNSEKVSEGNYKFTMPASKVTVTLKIKKTTSSTKNPYSGDTSNIYLWITILAASVVGLVALAAIYFLKRRK